MVYIRIFEHKILTPNSNHKFIDFFPVFYIFNFSFCIRKYKLICYTIIYIFHFVFENEIDMSLFQI